MPSPSNTPDTIDYKSYFEKGLSFDEYMQNMTAEASAEATHSKWQYIPLNLQRSKRIHKTLQLDEKIISQLKKLSAPLKWLVISEHWCGDASQIIPVMQALAVASGGMITLRIVYRDENPDLMNAHLTNGSKSIPKLLQLDENYTFMAEWGPRPETAQQMVIKLKSNPETATQYSEPLHKWYAEDKQQSILAELSQLLPL